MLFYHYWAESAIPAGTARILSGSLPRIGVRATVLIAGLVTWGAIFVAIAHPGRDGHTKG